MAQEACNISLILGERERHLSEKVHNMYVICNTTLWHVYLTIFCSFCRKIAQNWLPRRWNARKSWTRARRRSRRRKNRKSSPSPVCRATRVFAGVEKRWASAENATVIIVCLQYTYTFRIFRPDKFHFYIIEICLSIDHCAQIFVWEHTFAPREYLAQQIEQAFNKWKHLVSPGIYICIL